MKKFIRETNIPQQFKAMFEQEVYRIDPNTNEMIKFNISAANDPRDQSNDCVDIFGVLINTCANIMAHDEMKPEDGKAALVFGNLQGVGEMLMACVAEYVKDGDEGNWYYSFTFDPEDIKNIKPENVHPFNSMEKICPFMEEFNRCFAAMHMKSVDQEFVYGSTLCAIKTLINWLESAANEDEIVELVIDDVLKYNSEISLEDYNASMITFAIASAEVVKGVKKYSMSFGEEMKAVAKGNGDFTNNED